jgi:hypothetical protein
MAKDPSPLLGYNNNIRHKNRVFHIQTEDSGVRHPHIITHLFMDGGRILKSVKTSYADHLGVDKMADLVRKMMKDQHKGMLIALRDGQFDAVIDGGEAPKAVAKAPPVAAEGPANEVAAPAAPPVEALPLAPPPPPPPVVVAAPLPVPSFPAAKPALPVERVDVTELERAAARAPGLDAPLDLQPPPANLFRPRTGGAYSTLVDPTEAARPDATSTAGPGALSPVRPALGRPNTSPPGAVVSKSPGLRTNPSPAPGRPATLAPSANRTPPIRRTSSLPPAQPSTEQPGRPVRKPAVAVAVAAAPAPSRYASARPAAIFGQSRPSSGSSIFGEDIISDKSLDEVIMSYLADDLEPKDGSAKPAAPDPKRRK